MLTAQDFQFALDSQTACNLSGIVHQFSKILHKLWNESQAKLRGGFNNMKRLTRKWQTMNFDTKTNAYIEVNQHHANELFVLARQHRITYAALNEKAMNMYRPILEWFETKKQYDDLIKYVYDNIPDCVERVLYLHKIINRQEEEGQ